MAFVDKNRTVLTAIPVAPPYLFNETKLRGIYAIGDVKLRTGRWSTTVPPFQRWNLFPFITKFWIHDLIQGILIVFFISLLSELIHTVLLRTEKRRLSRSGVYLSSLIDDFSRFRLLLRHVAVGNRGKESGPHEQFNRIFPFFALCASVAVFIIDVSVIHTTQRIWIYTPKNEFNLQGIQPVAFRLPRTTQIRRRTAEMPCISPAHSERAQRRHFKITACIIQSTRKALSKENSLSKEITIGSWYHKGGNDHRISFGKGRHTIKVRAEITLEDEDRNVKRILFNNDGNTMNITRYFHELTMYWAMQWSCNQEFSRVDCLQLVRELKHVSSVPTIREINLWSTAGKEVFINATGLVSTYRVRMNAPHTALSRGMSVLVASSAIREVRGFARYENAITGEQEDGIRGLFSESARITGLWLFLLMNTIFGTILILLRLILQPVSISHMAVLTTHEVEPEKPENGIRFIP